MGDYIFMFVVLAIIIAVISPSFSGGSNPSDAERRKASISVPAGKNTVTLFCYDGTPLPELQWHEKIRVQFHASPIRLKSIYTGHSHYCTNYVTYDGKVIGALGEEELTELLCEVARKGTVHIYAQAFGYNKRGWPQLFAILPSKKRLKELAR